MDYKLTLKNAIYEIATISNTYRDFENSMNHIGISSEMLHELDIKYIVTHESDFGTSFLFYSDEQEAKKALADWYSGRLDKKRKSTTHMDTDGTFAVIIFQIGPYEQENHIFAIHKI